VRGPPLTSTGNPESIAIVNIRDHAHAPGAALKAKNGSQWIDVNIKASDNMGGPQCFRHATAKAGPHINIRFDQLMSRLPSLSRRAHRLQRDEFAVRCC